MRMRPSHGDAAGRWFPGGTSGGRVSLGSGSNPNLLTAPEDFSAAAWVASSVTVTTDVGDLTHPNADQLAFALSGSIRQTVTGLGVGGVTTDNTVTVTTSWQRFSVTDSQGGLQYTFSVELMAPGGAVALTLRYQPATTTGRLFLLDLSGVAPTVLAWGAKFEQAASFSGYP